MEHGRMTFRERFARAAENVLGIRTIGSNAIIRHVEEELRRRYAVVTIVYDGHKTLMSVLSLFAKHSINIGTGSIERIRPNERAFEGSRCRFRAVIEAPQYFLNLLDAELDEMSGVIDHSMVLSCTRERHDAPSILLTIYGPDGHAGILLEILDAVGEFADPLLRSVNAFNSLDTGTGVSWRIDVELVPSKGVLVADAVRTIRERLDNRLSEEEFRVLRFEEAGEPYAVV